MTLTDKHFPAYITVEQIARWLDRVALEIEAVEDPEPVIPWYAFLERELAFAKAREARMERVRETLRRAGRPEKALGEAHDRGRELADDPHHLTKECGEQDTAFTLATLDDMIAHEKLLERYPWLSAQILNRWRRKRLVRTFRGKGCVLYSMQELNRALESEMRLDDPAEVRQRPIPQISMKDEAVAAAIRHERSLRTLSKDRVLQAEWLDEVNRHREQVGLGPVTAEPRSQHPEDKAQKGPAPAGRRKKQS